MSEQLQVSTATSTPETTATMSAEFLTEPIMSQNILKTKKITAIQFAKEELCN